jgi:hypothetical protein
MDSGTARWFDLTVAGGESGESGQGAAEGGASGSSPWSSAPLRDVARTAARNEQSHATVLAALQGLRETGARGASIVAAADSGAIPAIGNSSSSAESAIPAPAPLLARASAFSSRLSTAHRLLGQSSLRGSPAAATERIAAALSSALRAASAEADRFPAAVRASSSRTLNEMRQLLDAGLREASAASSEAERAIASFGAEQGKTGDAARREAERTALALRDRAVRSEALAQLCLDVREAARLLAGSTAATTTASAFEALPDHVEALRRAGAPESVEREAECVALAFRGFMEAASAGSASPRAVPRELLDQISSAERRREMASMDRERAALLLGHTRQALSKMAAGDDGLRRLRVVEQILTIRARAEEDAGASTAALRHLARRWELRSSEVLRHLERVAQSARLAVQIAARAESSRRETTARMRAALARAVGDVARRVAQGSESKATRWRDEVGGAFAAGESALLREGQLLADAVTSGLELYVGTGLLMRGAGGGAAGEQGEGSGGADEDDEDEDDDEDAHGEGPLVPLSEWRRARELQSDRFAVSEQSGAGTAGTAARTSSSSSSSASRDLLRKTHALALEGYVAWVEYAGAVLLTNAHGSVRAASAIREALEPLRRRFEQMVSAQLSRRA